MNQSVSHTENTSGINAKVWISPCTLFPCKTPNTAAPVAGVCPALKIFTKKNIKKPLTILNVFALKQVCQYDIR